MILSTTTINYHQPWSWPTVLLFTGNAAIKINGAIVMGRGAARQVRDAWPGCDLALGQELRKHPALNLLFVPLHQELNQLLGWFKVKQHWADQADPQLIAASADALADLATRTPGVTFHLNYPGIGNGRLNMTEVEPLLTVLPDNVIVHRLDGAPV